MAPLSTNFWTIFSIFCLAWLIMRLYRMMSPRNRKSLTQSSNQNDKGAEDYAYNAIEPVGDSQYDQVQPLKLRGFKAPYHLTMGLQSSTLSDLIAMDKTYTTKIKLRRSLISTQERDVVACNPIAVNAVHELYTWIFNTYLPRRFPTYFSLSDPSLERFSQHKNISGGNDVALLHNLITHEQIPLKPPLDPIEALKTLGAHVDAEFAILLPYSSTTSPQHPPRILPTSEPSTSYHLHAYILTFPSGFSIANKLGMKLAHIHAPVPGYGVKLEKSMDRFFAGFGFGKVVKRQNWSVQVGEDLFRLKGNHLSTGPNSSSTGASGDQFGNGVEGNEGIKMAPPVAEVGDRVKEIWDKEGESVDPRDCRLRCERQTLHRLEKTGALVFAFKTYLYTLDEVIEDGLADEMADAVEGLGTGSVPAIKVYKRGVVWGSKVCEYLREAAARKRNEENENEAGLK